MCKFDIIFPYLQGIIVSKWLLKFISWWGLSQKWMTIIAEDKFHHLFCSVNIKENWEHLEGKNSRSFQDQEPRSFQYLGCHENISIALS